MSSSSDQPSFFRFDDTPPPALSRPKKGRFYAITALLGFLGLGLCLAGLAYGMRLTSLGTYETVRVTGAHIRGIEPSQTNDYCVSTGQSSNGYCFFVDKVTDSNLSDLHGGYIHGFFMDLSVSDDTGFSDISPNDVVDLIYDPGYYNPNNGFSTWYQRVYELRVTRENGQINMYADRTSWYGGGFLMLLGALFLIVSLWRTTRFKYLL